MNAMTKMTLLLTVLVTMVLTMAACGNSGDDDNNNDAVTTPGQCPAVFTFFADDEASITPNVLYLNKPGGFESPSFEGNQVKTTLEPGPHSVNFSYGNTFYAECSTETMDQISAEKGDLHVRITSNDHEIRLVDLRGDATGCYLHFLVTDDCDFGSAPGAVTVPTFGPGNDGGGGGTDTTTSDVLKICIVGSTLAGPLTITSDADTWSRHEVVKDANGKFCLEYPDVATGNYVVKARNGETVITAGTIPAGVEIWAQAGTGEASRQCDNTGVDGGLKIAAPPVDTCP